ncbi:M48 family metallopeptidase [Oceanobacter sp. 3_MG-2023]|uniref:M48 family metallopeptidase n=1 Tax=Oceanobacter sp. 3_MG-2023 TaxID=3062622 RepID=UPI002734D9F6|nr:M48 family metallopeptidase [Oceanobacter sp. 3_MG-2023]MDP2505468.1 M48 family metallopeptidase [Oceanobacter sp. 3_MG-2023]
MDFFNHQDQARKQTRRLILLFVLAVVALVAAINLLVALIIWYGQGQTINSVELAARASQPGLSFFDSLSTERILIISALVMLVIGLASLYRWLNLRGGGHVVAESLGGHRLPPNSSDFYERRLLNVVEEMAIAAGMPVPPVYVLDDDSINAFAAGYQASDAVVGVTRGCMTKLSRDQLQGVIAHEFSHIANGDMRLNIRLMALLFGILFIALSGRFIIEATSQRRLLSSSDKRNNSAPFWAIGLALLVLGYIGVFFGNLIKAAVSRQREFLADASAVQYTRNPESIGEALKVIGHGSGSDISSPEREETAHLFFGSAMHFSLPLFATHPPLEQRIRRIEPTWDGRYLAPQARADAEQANPELVDHSSSASRLAGVMGVAAAVAATSGRPDSASHAINTINSPADHQSGSPAMSLSDQARDPHQAQALIYALLLAPPERFVHDQQLNLILQQAGRETYQQALRLIPAIQALAPEQRLPLVELAIPALKQLSENQYRTFHTLLIGLMKADGQIDLFEWCLFRLLSQYLAGHFNKVTPVKARYSKPEAVADDIAVLLSFLAAKGHDDSESAAQAFQMSLADGAFGSLGIQFQPPGNSLKPLNQSLTRLTELYPHIKGRLIKSMVACGRADGILRPAERDLIHTIAAILETPVPAGVLAQC